MVSTFHGLNTLLRSVQAHQQALDTTNHNIANANTPGYSRQVARMAATPSYTAPGMNRPSGVPLQLGSGVAVEQVKRSRDAFVDLELRSQSHSHARWQTLAEGLAQIEGVFNEPGDEGLQRLVADYFNSWGNLSNNPESAAVRATVRAAGEAMATGFNEVARRLGQSRQGFDNAVVGSVAEVNDLASRLAALNRQVTTLQGLGDEPNDLRDSRDLVLDRLVDLTGATYSESDTGSVTVVLGDRVLVADDRAGRIEAVATAIASGAQVHRLAWLPDGGAPFVPGGQLGAQLELRDHVLPEKLRTVDLLASRITGAVNTQHRQGSGVGAYAATVTDFFDPMSASTPLRGTGLGNELTGGSATVGGQPVAVDPATQSLSDVMGAVTAAVEGAPGVSPGSASWALDAATGRLSVTYTATSPVVFGAPGDSSNLLQAVGLQGAATSVTNPGPPAVYTVTGTAPLALVSAARMRVDQNVENDLSAIAAAGSGAPEGDNRNSLAIAALTRTRFAALDEATFIDYYAAAVGTLGAETRQAEATSEHQGLLTQHLTRRRESVSGVSLDEEATRLIQYQRAYQAAARGIAVMDELLETVINRMGRVGT